MRIQPTFHGLCCLDELSHGASHALGESSQLVLEFWCWFLKNLCEEHVRHVRRMAAIVTGSPLLLVDAELDPLV